MARLTREQSRQRTRERLLDAAQEVFAREGYAAASVEQIAEVAEYSKGAIYSNFDSKEALFLELLERNLNREKRAMRAIAAESNSAQEIIDGIIRRFVLFEDKLDQCLLVTEFQMEAGRREEVAKPFAQLFRAHRRELSKLLVLLAAKAQRKLPEQPELLAISVLSLAGGLALQRAADPKSVPRGMLTRSVRLFMGNLFHD
jgi:TetR/AcrR family transcriptional regulator, transcriptional repressor of aconitase